MQIQVDIGFDQLVQIAKRLPTKQWTKLKKEVEKDKSETGDMSEMEHFLMSAPTFSEQQIKEIENVRNEMSQWRKK